jgi:hypothetical protein
MSQRLITLMVVAEKLTNRNQLLIIDDDSSREFGIGLSLR